MVLSVWSGDIIGGKLFHRRHTRIWGGRGLRRLRRLISWILLPSDHCNALLLDEAESCSINVTELSVCYSTSLSGEAMFLLHAVELQWLLQLRFVKWYGVTSLESTFLILYSVGTDAFVNSKVWVKHKYDVLYYWLHLTWILSARGDNITSHVRWPWPSPKVFWLQKAML